MKDLVDIFRDWEKVHNSDNYGRYDAFKAGYQLSRREIGAALDERDALRAEVERLKADGIHTCHSGCQRTACVLRRQLAEQAECLREAVKVIEELVDILDDSDARKQVDSFTAQPAREFLASSGKTR